MGLKKEERDLRSVNTLSRSLKNSLRKMTHGLYLRGLQTQFLTETCNWILILPIDINPYGFLFLRSVVLSMVP